MGGFFRDFVPKIPAKFDFFFRDLSEALDWCKFSWRGGKFVFPEVGTFSSLLSFCMGKKKEDLTFCRRNQQINWSVCRCERICWSSRVCFVDHWKISQDGPRPMALVSSNFAKQIKKTLHKRKKYLFLLKKGKIQFFFKDQGREKSRKTYWSRRQHSP